MLIELQQEAMKVELEMNISKTKFMINQRTNIESMNVLGQVEE